jgi:nitric oxide reductase subunit C
MRPAGGTVPAPMDSGEKQEHLECEPTESGPTPCGWKAKAILLGVLVLAFVVQSGLVYTDPPGTVILEGKALAGRQIWQRENCQACHQIYGFGGFLGPDLTNAAARMERSQLDEMLTVGRKQMPAFGFEPDEIDSVWAFLVALNKTGAGQARHPDLARAAGAPVKSRVDAGSTPGAALAQAADEHEDKDVAVGLRLFQTRTCIACHVLFARSAIGAPDLSLTASKLSSEEILAVLENGKMPLMPPAALSPEERLQVLAFIDFLGEYRATRLDKVTGKARSFWVTLPWWEYE